MRDVGCRVWHDVSTSVWLQLWKNLSVEFYLSSKSHLVTASRYLVYHQVLQPVLGQTGEQVGKLESHAERQS